MKLSPREQVLHEALIKIITDLKYVWAQYQRWKSYECECSISNPNKCHRCQVVKAYGDDLERLLNALP